MRQQKKRSRDQEIKGSRDQEIKRSRDQEIKRSRDQEIKRGQKERRQTKGGKVCDETGETHLDVCILRREEGKEMRLKSREKILFAFNGHIGERPKTPRLEVMIGGVEKLDVKLFSVSRDEKVLNGGIGIEGNVCHAANCESSHVLVFVLKHLDNGSQKSAAAHIASSFLCN